MDKNKNTLEEKDKLMNRTLTVGLALRIIGGLFSLTVLYLTWDKAAEEKQNEKIIELQTIQENHEVRLSELESFDEELKDFQKEVRKNHEENIRYFGEIKLLIKANEKP